MRDPYLDLVYFRSELERQVLTEEIVKKMRTEIYDRFEDLERKVNIRFCWIIIFICIYNLTKLWLLE